MSEERIIEKIRIVKTPEGPAPESVRINWLGIELLAVRTPPEAEERDFTTFQEIGNRGGYMVDVKIAIRKLREKSPQAAEWFKKNVPSDMDYFTFGPDEVELLPNATISKEDF
jgi:hypothetical protein